MKFPPLLILHIVTASIGLLSGAGALIFAKGSYLHRVTGNTFLISMLIMSGLGAYLAYLKSVTISVEVGLLVFYLVATAKLTLMPQRPSTRRLESAVLLVGLLSASIGWVTGLETAANGTDAPDGSTAAPYFVFGSIALTAAALDIRMFVNGALTGFHRLVRHLWRMCFAMLIATISLFIGQPKLFSPAIHATHLLPVPVFAVIASFIYWLFHVKNFYRARSAPTFAPIATRTLVR